MVGIKDFDIPKNCKECIFKIENRCLIINRSSFNAIYHDIKRKDCPLIEAIPKADHETRLKADLVAMLTEIQLEIEEMDSGCGWEGYRPTAQVLEVIQQKINALRGNEDA